MLHFLALMETQFLVTKILNLKFGTESHGTHGIILDWLTAHDDFIATGSMQQETLESQRI